MVSRCLSFALLLLMTLPFPAEGNDLPNVLIIGIDTMRGDYLHSSGNDWIRTPHLDALAGDGILFTRCYSTAPWTLPSFASIFTGLLPYRHGAIGGDYLRLSDDINTITEYFAANGFTTAGYVSINYLTPAFGMGQGFNAPFPEGLDPNLDRASRITWLGQKFVDDFGGGRFFGFLHYFDVHAPYQPPEGFARAYYDGDETAPGVPISSFLLSEWNKVPNRANGMYDWLDGVTDIEFPIREYAASVTYVDDHVGQVTAHLKETGLYDSTLIIVVSDHGEHLGEHDIWFTHVLPYQEAIHVPLIIKMPGSQLGGQVIDHHVSTLDIAPTLMELYGIPMPDLDGRSLLPLIKGEADRSGSLLVAEQGSEERDFCKTLIDWPWKLMYFREPEGERYVLYNLVRDPGETQDRSAAEANIVKRMRIRLWQIFDPGQPLSESGEALPADMDENARRTLRSLGY